MTEPTVFGISIEGNVLTSDLAGFDRMQVSVGPKSIAAVDQTVGRYRTVRRDLEIARQTGEITAITYTSERSSDDEFPVYFDDAAFFVGIVVEAICKKANPVF